MTRKILCFVIIATFIFSIVPTVTVYGIGNGFVENRPTVSFDNSILFEAGMLSQLFGTSTVNQFTHTYVDGTNLVIPLANGAVAGDRLRLTLSNATWAFGGYGASIDTWNRNFGSFDGSRTYYRSETYTTEAGLRVGRDTQGTGSMAEPEARYRLEYTTPNSYEVIVTITNSYPSDENRILRIPLVTFIEDGSNPSSVTITPETLPGVSQTITFTNILDGSNFGPPRSQPDTPVAQPPSGPSGGQEAQTGVELVDTVLPINTNVETYNGDLLAGVTDAASALNAVQTAIDRIGLRGDAQHPIMDSPDDLFTLLMFAEEAISLAATTYVDEGPIFINRPTVSALTRQAREVEAAMILLLAENGIELDRELRRTVNFKTRRTQDIHIVVEPSAGHVEFDQARVLTSAFSVTFTRAFIIDTCTNMDPGGNDEDFVITDVDFTVDVSALDDMNGIKYFPKHPTDLPVILELPQIEGDRRLQSLIDIDKDVRLISIYNDITGRIEGQNFTGSTIIVQRDEVIIRDNRFFDDLIGQDRAVIEAVNQLAAQNVLVGREGLFHPEEYISRAEISVIISKMMALPRGTHSFDDVPVRHWAWDPIRRMASTDPVILAGTTPTTFSPDTSINRVQLIAIAGRCLSMRNFRAPSDPVAVLRDDFRFTDYAEVLSWVNDIENVALAVYSNVNFGSADNRFQPGRNMTRGHAAVVLQRLYRRLGHMR